MKENDIRETPRWLLEQLDAEFQFTLDVAATHENAVCDTYYTEQGLWQNTDERGPLLWRSVDGLTGLWFGSVWCNPPFSDLWIWVEKAWAEMARRDGPASIVMLCPGNRQEQPGWQKLVEPFRDRDDKFRTRHPPGRIRFTVNGGQPIYKRDKAGNICRTKKGEPIIGSASFGCVLLVWRR